MQMNFFDWIDEIMKNIETLKLNNCRFINEAINRIFSDINKINQCLSGECPDHEAEKIIYEAAKLRNEHARKMHRKKKDLVWNFELIEV